MLESVLKYRCPRCRKGNLFYKPFTFDTAYKMPEHCTVCNQDYFPEPGFYFGAMFVSYIFSGFLLVSIALILVFVFRWSVNGSLGLVILIGALSHNFFFRFSRSLWLHLMVRYRGEPKVRSKDDL